MITFLKAYLGLKNDSRAVTALEYALIAGAIGAVVTAGFSGFGAKIAGLLSNAAS